MLEGAVANCGGLDLKRIINGSQNFSGELTEQEYKESFDLARVNPGARKATTERRKRGTERAGREGQRRSPTARGSERQKDTERRTERYREYEPPGRGQRGAGLPHREVPRQGLLWWALCFSLSVAGRLPGSLSVSGWVGGLLNGLLGGWAAGRLGGWPGG